MKLATRAILSVLVVSLWGCQQPTSSHGFSPGTPGSEFATTSGSGSDGPAPGGPPSGDETSDSGGATGAASTDSPGGTSSTTVGSGPDQGSTGPDEPSPVAELRFNIILQQTVQACSGCGIWFDWQGQDANKPRLEVTWSAPGQPSTTSIYQHGSGPDGDAFGYFLSPEASPGSEDARHSLLVKQAPARRGLISVDLFGIPGNATIESATLHLHLNTDEGLANNDNESVLEVWECPTTWDWDGASWDQADDGVPWQQPGGDFGVFIREIRAYEDMHALGYSKANPSVPFDFTDYVAQLQALR